MVCCLEQHSEGFSATLRVNVTTIDDVNKWLTEFQQQTKTTFRIQRTVNNSQVLYKVSMLQTCALFHVILALYQPVCLVNVIM